MPFKVVWHRIVEYLKFYWRAETRYRLHSPHIFSLAEAVLENPRRYYAFRDVEWLREQMRDSESSIELVDYGGEEDARPETSRLRLREILHRAASSPAQGRLLFLLTCWAAPRKILELGTSLGLSAMYIASAARTAKMITLEGAPACADLARVNFSLLGLRHVEVKTGPFRETLPVALQEMQAPDLVFIDGHHRPGPVLQYFETCLAHANPGTVFVFDDMYWSPDMTEAWKKIQAHGRVTMTVDFFDLSLAFINPDFREKQHFRVVSVAQKPWQVLSLF
ncbi:MAG: class I SAM-dependent methyltransferase [Lewinellaceae bacterium]|nr:class I SAM-dependent methyltransferase [Saprospiraceae bacterium]MCB0544857.1 class I SAM-dependent methyltransferase [Saprospiraceae bacterium]MCB9306841.1 class I SAM-dependent methyltransferase [Lewinellaceae bacterium]MCB9356409.1 class I SAM-dependent methyltransferase [Lewinellaceae bacterium]